MASLLPVFKKLGRIEVDATPTDETSMHKLVRVYAIRGSTPLPPSEWGFTYAEVMAQEAAVKAEAMAELRKKRNALLQEADAITMSCYSRGIPVPVEWATYQQALRDLPATSSPNFSDSGKLVGVVWPVKPSTKP